MNNFHNEPVGTLVAEQPLRAAVFDKFGIDFCCKGKLTLAEACLKDGLDRESVVAAIHESDEEALRVDNLDSWFSASLTELVDHIERTHHSYLERELPRLEELADKVARVHGLRQPRLRTVQETFSTMRKEIEAHTAAEEEILFPFIRRLDSESLSADELASIENPVTIMESEHDDVGKALMQLRELTDQYVAPESACASWRALLGGLAHLDEDLRTHIHKENSILFPRTVAAERFLKFVGNSH